MQCCVVSFVRWSALVSGSHPLLHNVHLCAYTNGLFMRRGHWLNLWDWPRWIQDMALLVKHSLLSVQFISSGEILPSTFKKVLAQVYFLLVIK